MGKTREQVGYVFLIIGFCVLVYVIIILGAFIRDPNTFHLYKLLAELPEIERTLSINQRSLVLAVGIFKALGMVISFILLFVALSLVKLFFNIGVKLIAPKIDDLVDKLLNKLRGEAFRERLTTQQND